MLRVRSMAEETEGNGAVNSFTQLDEEQGQFVSFLSETVSVAVGIRSIRPWRRSLRRS